MGSLFLLAGIDLYGLDPTDIEGIIKRTRVGDLSDITTAITPQPSLLENYGIRAKDFILSCTIDGRVCSYK